jgi:hypothetical protein
MAIKEQVTIEVDVEGDGLKKLAADAKKVKRSLDGVDKASDKAAGGFAKQAELAERMRAALGPLGDVLGDLTGGLDDTMVALEGFSAKQVAATAGVLVAVAAVFKFSGAVFDVIANLDDYGDQLDRLQGRGIIDDQDIEQLRMANTAIRELGEEFTGLFVATAAAIAPFITDFSRGLVAVLGFVQGGFDGAADSVDSFNRALAKSKQVAQEVKASTTGAADAVVEMPEKLAAVLPDMVAAFKFAMADVGAEVNAEVVEVVTVSRQTVEGLLKATHDTVGAIGTIYDVAIQQRIDAEKQGSAEQKKLMKRQFAANKAFAITQATINTALAVMNALTVQPAYLGIVLAATAAATGAAQIAVIAAQKPPSFHRGGIMPDEQASFGGAAITRRNEAGVVFTAQGQRTFADAVNALNRGDSTGGGGITVMLDSQPIRGVVHQMGQADPAYGHRRRQ